MHIAPVTTQEAELVRFLGLLRFKTHLGSLGGDCEQDIGRVREGLLSFWKHSR